jgi:dTMP kinase
VSRINHFAVGHQLPDLTFVLDVPVEIGLERVRSRKSDRPDRIEAESAAFFERVRAGYIELAQAETRRVVLVDGTLEAAQVESLIWKTVHERLA